MNHIPPGMFVSTNGLKDEFEEKLFEKNKVENIEDSEFLLCTGLFDNYEDERGRWRPVCWVGAC